MLDCERSSSRLSSAHRGDRTPGLWQGLYHTAARLAPVQLSACLAKRGSRSNGVAYLTMPSNAKTLVQQPPKIRNVVANGANASIILQAPGECGCRLVMGDLAVFTLKSCGSR